jgi:dTDP-D-glucose 4,6-dehydratase
MRLLVCGGAGFIGSNFVRLRVRDEGDEVVVLDKLTYAGRRENLADLDVRLVVGDIADQAAVDEAIGDSSVKEPSSIEPYTSSVEMWTKRATSWRRTASSSW